MIPGSACPLFPTLPLSDDWRKLVGIGLRSDVDRTGQLKVSPEALAETAVQDLLALPDDESLELAQPVVEDDRELYERFR